MMEISWKIYAVNLLMETMCWEIRVDAGGFLKGVIPSQCYGIILRFQGNGTRGSFEHPGSADLTRTMQSEVIGSVEQGMGMLNPAGTSGRGFGRQARQHQSESEGFSLRTTQVSCEETVRAPSCP